MPPIFSPNIECKVPDWESGIWRVKTIFRDDIAPSDVIPKSFKGLFRKDKLVMTSMPVDVEVHKALWKNAKGSVLLTGLGLGIAIQLILDKTEVNDITVLEKDIDVIWFVGSAYKHPKVKIIHADAFKWIPPKDKIYDCIWHDIFNDKKDVNKKDIERLHDKYAPFARLQGMR